MSARPEDRRGAERAAFDARVKLVGAKTSGGHILNLSVGGLLVEAERASFAAGSEVLATFRLPGRERAIAARAEVVRVQGGTRVGLRFLRLSADEHAAIQAFVQAGGAS